MDAYSSKSSEAALYQLGRETAGPLLTAYVAWILKEAKRQKLTRLYFVARDGQILWKIAQQSHLSRDIELHYLYGSRQAWHLPAITELNEFVWAWLFDAAPILSLERIAKRLSFSPEEFLALLPEAAVTHWTLQQSLTPADIQQIKKILQIKSVEIAILARAKKRREQAIDYFAQEGLLKDANWAMIDIGWHGRMQDSLQTILATADHQAPVRGFYFGLHESRKIDLCWRQAFCFDPNSSKKERLLGRRLASFLEIFTSADHGSTQGYIFSPDLNRWTPSLAEQKVSDLQRWGLYHLQQGILSATDSLQSQKRDESRIFWYTTMERLIKRPTWYEAETIGSFPFCSDQIGEYGSEFAPALTVRQAVAYLLAVFQRKEQCFTYWLEGSLLRSSSMAQPLLKLSIALQAIKEYLKSLRML